MCVGERALLAASFGNITINPEGDRFTGTLSWTLSSSCTSATCVIDWSLDGTKE